MPSPVMVVMYLPVLLEKAVNSPPDVTILVEPLTGAVSTLVLPVPPLATASVPDTPGVMFAVPLNDAEDVEPRAT